MKAIRILQVIADPATLEKFRGLLLQQKEEMEVAGEASTASVGLDLAEKLKPDMILIDLVLLKESGFDLIRQLKKTASPAKVLVLRARVSLQDPLLLRELIVAGAAGVIETEETPERILKTIRLTAAGRNTIGNLLMFANMTRRYPEGDLLSAFRLTSRETDVLKLILAGQSDQNISVSLGISENTVMKYKYAIYTKLLINNTANNPFN